MFTPMFAIANISAPRTSTTGFGTSARSSAGSVIASPKTSIVAAVVSTDTSANAVELMGSPRRLPLTTDRRSGAKREKSQKFSISVP
jgi:hypothetical protein